MRASIVVPVLLGAGAFAHPHFKLNNPLAHLHHKRNAPAEVHTTTVNGVIQVEEVYVQTIWGPDPPSSTPVPTTTPAAVVAPQKLAVKPVEDAPKTTSTPAVIVHNYNHHNKGAAEVQQSTTPIPSPKSTTPVPEVPKSSTPAAVPSNAAVASNGGEPKSGGKSILDSANKFRAIMGLPAFTYSGKLDANAAKTNNDNGADKMKHQLNDGSNAQCITQVNNLTGDGVYTPFELSYLGWLCEIPDGRLGDACKAMDQATHMRITETGHAEILRNAGYKNMGCNYLTSKEPEKHPEYQGMWTCDFAN